MTYFKDILTVDDLKKVYRHLALRNHPDKGGNMCIMQQINEEYSIYSKGFASKPYSLHELKVGNTVYVNRSKCIVTEVEKKCFKAISLKTNRQAYFDKTTGMALFNFKLRASLGLN